MRPNTRRVEHREFFDGVPEGAKQFRPFAMLNHVLCKLANVEIQRDEFVDVGDFAIGNLRFQVGMALTTGDDFAPDFGGQRKFIRRGFIPAVALGHVTYPGMDFFWQRNFRALFDRVVNVTVGIFPE